MATITIDPTREITQVPTTEIKQGHRIVDRETGEVLSESAEPSGAGMSATIEGGKNKEAPTRRIVPPAEDAFTDVSFLTAPELTRLATELRRKHNLPTEFSLAVVWKGKGGASGGSPTLSKATLATSGLLGFYCEHDAVIWLAADHCRTYNLDGRQIEALLYHELCHLDVDEKTLAPVIVNHDFAGFLAELKHYGAWDHTLGRAKGAFEQAALL